MSLEVLLSTMNLKSSKDYLRLIKKMNIKSSITINQITKDEIECFDLSKNCNRLLSYKEKGLSKSRNKALLNSKSDICVIADDDLEYVNNYDEIVLNAYSKYKDADIIAFDVPSINVDRVTSTQKEGRVNYLKSMKISSFQLTFKRKSIIDSNISFDERFGAGSGLYTCGEENIFLFDCLKKGLKVYYCNQEIAEVNHSDSTWYNGFDENLFITKGAMFYRMSSLLCNIFILQFAIRKYKYYKNDFSLLKVIKIMKKGKNQQKEYIKKEQGR